MTSGPGSGDGPVPADPPRGPEPVCPRSTRRWPGLWPMLALIPPEHLRTSLIRKHPRPVAAPSIHQHRPGWHARDIAVEKAG